MHTHAHTARLQERLHDKEEKVRMEVVRAISEAAADNMQAIPQSVRCSYIQSAFGTDTTVDYVTFIYCTVPAILCACSLVHVVTDC